ncbi:hypothetical protein BJ322DRAFT_240673 [Thelephora terrestris]|uniref:DUF6593 domain-containing protein n=1 Tax=Thelephora terrestris TaxID=56493 RepID=A0A9P6H8H9_9AGAM|nr:hypothetical protein BJ322DRAFT_240673 [Thelephora terrestris]
MSGCTLRFARNSPLRTTLVDEATGHAKYKLETPMRIARSVTRIRKFESPAQSPLHSSEEDDSDSGDDDIAGNGKEGKPNPPEENETEGELQETSDEMARIYWKWFSSNRIIFRGRITTRDELLPKCGKLKGSFTFTGPDGVQYRWALGSMGMNRPKLVTIDDKTVIAEFHRPNHITNKQKARLEVQPAGMNMLDHIVLTFVIVDQTRREREAAAWHTVPWMIS